jgi:pSer/pThr/pTyr-binding forkhead associated (FHA) protein
MNLVQDGHLKVGRMQTDNTIHLMHFAERHCSIQASRPHSASHVSADSANYIGIHPSDTEQHHTLRGDVLSMRIGSAKDSAQHCQIWCSDGRWYIKDTKSTLGTFLNYVRLSKPGIESSAYLLHDGDIVQLGQSGSCESKESGPKRFLVLIGNNGILRDNTMKSEPTSNHKVKDNHKRSAEMIWSNCSICLKAVLQKQASIVASCGHMWHYSCLQQSIQMERASRFLCPRCLVYRLSAIADRPDYLTESPRYSPSLDCLFPFNKWCQLLGTSRVVMQRKSASILRQRIS